MKFKLKKLNPLGVAHHLALVVIILAIAIGGTYELVSTHAATASHKYLGHIGQASCSLIAASAHDDLHPNNHVQVSVTLTGGPLTSPVTLGPTQVAGPDSSSGSNTASWATPAAVANSTTAGTVTLTERVYDGGTAASNEVSFTPPQGDSKTATIHTPCKSPSQGGSGGSSSSTYPHVSATVSNDITTMVNCLKAAESNSNRDGANAACSNTCNSQASQLGTTDSASLYGACSAVYVCAVEKYFPAYDKDAGINCNGDYKAIAINYLNATYQANNPIKLYPAVGDAFKSCKPGYSQLNPNNFRILYPTPCNNGLFVLGTTVWYNKGYMGHTGAHLYTYKQAYQTAGVHTKQPADFLCGTAKPACFPDKFTLGCVYQKNSNGLQGQDEGASVTCNSNGLITSSNSSKTSNGGAPSSSSGSGGTTTTQHCTNPNATPVGKVGKCTGCVSGYVASGTNSDGVTCVKKPTTTGSSGSGSTSSKKVTLVCSDFGPGSSTKVVPGKSFTVSARIRNTGNTTAKDVHMDLVYYKTGASSIQKWSVGDISSKSGSNSKYISVHINKVPAGTTRIGFPTVTMGVVSGVSFTNQCHPQYWLK